MDRVQGWYKRMTQVVIFIVAAVVVIFMNADALRFADSLAVNPQVRAAVVAAADPLASRRLRRSFRMSLRSRPSWQS